MFKIANFFVLLLTLVLSVHPTSAQPTANLVAHYALATNAIDTGTNGNNGLVVSSVAFNTGYSATFNSSPQDDAGYIFAYPALNRNTSFTISAWVFPTYYNVGLPATIMYERAGGDACGAASAPNYGMQIYAGRFSFDISTLTNGACTLNRISSPDTVTLNEWSHVLATYDNITGTQRLYVNGALRAEATVGTELRTVANARFAMSRNLGGTQAFHGDMADVRVYDRVLTATEIGQLVPASVVRKQIIVPATAYPGTQFTNPLGAQSASCSITAYGLWSNGQGAQTTDADGYGSACNQCPETGSPSQRLVMQRGASWEPIGKTKQVSLSSNEIVRFANNDSIGFYPDNTGSMTLDIVCEEPTPVPTVTLTLPRATILTQTIAHGDGHTGARMDDGITAGQELRTSETLQVDCSNTCVWSASVEPISASSWLKFTSANSGAAQPGGPGLLTFSIDPFEDTVSSRSGTIRVTANGGATTTWQVTQNPLTDWDEDGVADEWERRGHPRSTTERDPLQGKFVDASGVIRQSQAPYGRIPAIRPITEAEREQAKANNRDLWLWLDHMVGVSRDALVTDYVMSSIAKSFAEQGIQVTWQFGRGRLAQQVVDIVNSSAYAALKEANLRPTQADAWRDVVYRHIVWASTDNIRPSGAGTKTVVCNKDTERGTIGSAFSAAYDRNMIWICGASPLLTADSLKASTIMHELGHELGLGHGGPWFANQEDYVDRVLNGRSVWKEGDYDSEDNLKVNHLSLMNYRHALKGGLVARSGVNTLDYQRKNYSVVDERNLATFWNAPLTVASTGVNDPDYGVRFSCGNNQASATPPNGQAACRDGTTPRQTDLDYFDGRVGSVVRHETKPEWQRILLTITPGFIGNANGFGARLLSSLSVKSASAGTLLGIRDEPTVESVSSPENIRLSLSHATEEPSVAPGQQFSYSFVVKNLGFAVAQRVSITVTASDGLQVAAPQEISVAPSSTAEIPLQISVSQTAIVGAVERMIVEIKSVEEPWIKDGKELEVRIVDPFEATQPATLVPIQPAVMSFAFAPASSVPTNVYVESDAVTLSAASGPLDIQVRGGEMSINSGPWNSYLSHIQAGDTLRLRVLSSPFGGDIRTAEVAVGGLVRAFRVTTAVNCDLDIDGDGIVDVSTDGVLLSRHLLGYRGSALTNGLTLSGVRVTPQAITDFIGSGAQYDVFGQSVLPLGTADGLVLTRLMQGLPDIALLKGVDVPGDAVFTAPGEIRSYVSKKCGTNLAAP